MREIVASVSRVTDVIGEISAAAKEQSSGIGQVNTAVSEMDTLTQRNAMMVQQTSSAAGDMRNHAERLNELISSFVLGGETTQSQSPSSPRSSARPAMAPQRLSDGTEARRRSQPEGEAWESF
jgi:methyl-accepting chemotaxis protein